MILVLLYATGLRRTEAARIKVEDIDSQRMVSRVFRGKFVAGLRRLFARPQLRFFRRVHAAP